MRWVRMVNGDDARWQGASRYRSIVCLILENAEEMFMDWKNRLMRLKADGNTYGEIAEILNNEYDEHFTGDRVRGWWRRNGHKTEHYDLLSHLRRGASLGDITDDAKVSERVALAMLEDLSDKGICVEEVNGVYRELPR